MINAAFKLTATVLSLVLILLWIIIPIGIGLQPTNGHQKTKQYPLARVIDSILGCHHVTIGVNNNSGSQKLPFLEATAFKANPTCAFRTVAAMLLWHLWKPDRRIRCEVFNLSGNHILKHLWNRFEPIWKETIGRTANCSKYIVQNPTDVTWFRDPFLNCQSKPEST